MMNENISKKQTETLAKAYMRVYKAFVNAYQSKGVTRAQAQFNAICIMRKIIMTHQNQKDNPAIIFLNKLYNTHRKIVAKKTMLSPDKNEITPKTLNVGTTVVAAMNDFEMIIATTTLNFRLSSKKAPSLPNVFVPKKKPKRNFSSWLNDTASPVDIDKLQNDIGYFGKLYKRYVMRQSHR